MKAHRPWNQLALTRIDLVVILAVITVLGFLLLPALHRTKAKSQRIQCVSNLKQLGLSFRITARNHLDSLPFPSLPPGISTTNAALYYYQSTTNLLTNPQFLHCPSDNRPAATNPANLTTLNLSYFINPQASEIYPQSALHGDRNLTSNGIPVRPGLVALTNGVSWGWDQDMHKRSGNVALGDGSVQMMNSLRSGSAPHATQLAVP